jgi:hypothetical protein
MNNKKITRCPQVIEEYGAPERIRTSGLLLRRLKIQRFSLVFQYFCVGGNPDFLAQSALIG